MIAGFERGSIAKQTQDRLQQRRALLLENNSLLKPFTQKLFHLMAFTCA
jgi:hypothetical protein